MVAVFERFDRRFDDMIRRLKIRLAYSQIDHRAACCGKRLRAGEHGESVLLANSVKCFDRLHHGGPASGWKVS
jgi:hypothetical protein